MSDWNDVQDLIDEFAPQSAENDREALRRELVKQLSELHPDKTGGAFQTAEQQRQFLRIGNAISFLEQLPSPSREITVASAPDLPATVVDAVSKAVAIYQQAANVHEAQNARLFRESYESRVRSQMRLVRVPSGVFAAISAVIFSVWDYTEKNPILGSFLELPLSQFVWLTAFLFFGLVFLWTWLFEQLSQNHAEYLLSEEGIISVFAQLLRSKLIFDHNSDLYPVSDPDGLEFAKRDLTALLVSSWSHHTGDLRGSNFMELILGSYTKLPPKSASECADVLLARLKNRNSLLKLERTDLDEWYRIPHSAVARLGEWFYEEYGYSIADPLRGRRGIWPKQLTRSPLIELMRVALLLELAFLAAALLTGGLFPADASLFFSLPSSQPQVTDIPTPMPTSPSGSASTPQAACPQGCSEVIDGCEIKGDISDDTMRVYYLPGEPTYTEITIDPETGERWFCTEEEATENGWQVSQK